MGGKEMSGGMEVIAFQRDKHTFHITPRCVIIYCPIGHVLPPLNVFIFIKIFFIYFLRGHWVEEMTPKPNIWRAIMAARMQFVLYLREKKGAVMPRGGHFIPCSDIFNGGARRTPGRSLSRVLSAEADGSVHRTVAAAALPLKLRLWSFFLGGGGGDRG